MKGVETPLTRARDYVTSNPFASILLGGLLVFFLDLVRRVAFGELLVSQLATYLWDGLTLGLVIGLAGVGLSMTYSILNFANFSHGDLVTSGAFVGWVVTVLIAGFGRLPLSELVVLGGPAGLDTRTLDVVIQLPGTRHELVVVLAILLGLVVAGLGTMVISVLVDRIVYRPMRDAEGISLLIASVGVALILRYLIVFVFQTDLRGVTPVQQVPNIRVPMIDGTLSVSAHQVTLVIASVVLMVAVHFLLQRTKLGKAMRAMADNTDLARVTGIPSERIVLWTWMIGGALAGVAGYLIALERGTIVFLLGWKLLLLIFSAVILGGIGSIYGAMAGGIIIGIATTLTAVWLPSEFTRAAAFAVMIIVLLYRPQGLFKGVSTA